MQNYHFSDDKSDIGKSKTAYIAFTMEDFGVPEIHAATSNYTEVPMPELHYVTPTAEELMVGCFKILRKILVPPRVCI